MKKSITIIGLLFALSSLSADYTNNSNNQNGGFKGPSIGKTNIVNALKLDDNSPVVLEGRIIKHLGKDKYVFKDATGEINIEIDNDKWRGLTVSPNDVVVIFGEIERGWKRIKVDVDSIAKK